MCCERVLSLTEVIMARLHFGGAGERLFDFSTKVRLESKAANSKRRSSRFKTVRKNEKYDVWSIRPLDLQPQAFEPRPPKRNSREAVRPWTYGPQSDRVNAGNTLAATESVHKIPAENTKRKEEALKALQNFRDVDHCGQKSAHEDEDGELKLHFRPMDPHEARIDFVRRGRHPPGKYEMPKVFNHREYEPLGTFDLPDFVTDSKNKETSRSQLRTIHGPQVFYRRETGANTKKDYEEVRHLQYDSELILPKLPFPNKYAAYSRHRRTDRSARSAYMDRAEQMLTKRGRELQFFRQTSICS